jgi:hypothetical protein
MKGMILLVGLVVGAVVLGAIGYGIYRWTDVPEQVQGWMDEQDLKAFPTQARRQLNDMRQELEGYRTTRGELRERIIAREGRPDWGDDVLKREVRGLATAVWYERMVDRRENAIRDIVTQVQAQRQEALDSGLIDADTGALPASHEYSVTVPSGAVRTWTMQRAREETDKIASDLAEDKRKLEMQQRLIARKTENLEKLDSLIGLMEDKVKEMERFIDDMEIEMQMLEIEQSIHDINSAIAGDGDNRFGSAIAKFRERQREFLAQREALNEQQVSEVDDGYFSTATPTPGAGTSASYWD